MVQLEHNQRNTTKAVAVVAGLAALGLTIAIATSLEPPEVASQAGVTPSVEFIPSWNLDTTLDDGPVAGMPQSTFESLVAGDAAVIVVPTLTDGPVPGMPQSTYESLVAGDAAVVVVPTTADGPVSGMPQSTFESLTRS